MRLLVESLLSLGPTLSSLLSYMTIQQSADPQSFVAMLITRHSKGELFCPYEKIEDLETSLQNCTKNMRKKVLVLPV